MEDKLTQAGQMEVAQTKQHVALRRSSTSIVSPLRYPGAKRRLAGYIAAALTQNKCRPKVFIEPFAGGASVALQLANDGIVENIVLADRDPLVAAFWLTVFNDADWLIQQVKTIEITLEKWISLKQTTHNTRRKRALACLFLNRTSFSGILAPGAGPIGGRRQSSAYDISCRFPRNTLVKRIQQASALSNRVVSVWDTSWEKTLQRVRALQDSNVLPRDVFWYFDPPFFEKADRLYSYYFQADDHRKMRDVICALEDPYILSYDSVGMVEELYDSTNTGRTHVESLYCTSRTAGNSPQSEAIITNLRMLPSETRLWRSKEEWSMMKGQASRLVTNPPKLAAADD